MARPVRVRLLDLKLRLRAPRRASGATAAATREGAARAALFRWLAGAAAASALPVPAVSSEVAGELPRVEVVAPAPLPGVLVPTDALPVGVQSAGRQALATGQPATIVDVLVGAFTGVHASSAQSNPFQPDLSYRGLTVSPLLGSQSGLVVLVDGVRVNESFGDVVLWDLLPMAAVDRVDLVPGGGPVFGPNALGGTLQVRTRTGREFDGVEAKLGAGSFGGRAAEVAVGGARGGFDGFFAASARDDDGWRDRSPSRVRQLHAKAGWEDARSRVVIGYTHADNALTGNGLAPEPLLAGRRAAVYTYPDESQPRLHFWTAEASHAFGDGARLAARAYYRDLRIDTLNGDAEYDDADTPFDPADDEYEAEFRRGGTDQRTAGAAAQLAWDGRAAGWRHRVAAGATYDAGRANYAQYEQEGRFLPGRGVSPTGEFEPDTLVRSRTHYASVYATDTVELDRGLHVTLAGRYDRARVALADRSGTEPDLNGRHAFTRFSPSIGVAWRAKDWMTLRASYAEGFRVPTPVELTCASPDDPCALPVAFVADPPLRPVVSRTWEAGLAAEQSGFELRGTVFRTALRDDILFTGLGAGRGFFANVPSTQRQGVELEIGGGSGRLAWRAGYAFVDATYRSAVRLFNPVAAAADPSQPDAIDVRAGDRLPATPRHLLRLSAEWHPRPRTTVGATLTRTSSQYLRGDDANEAPPLPPYSLVGVRVEQRIGSRLVAELSIDNLLDERYATIGAFNRSAFDTAGDPLAGGPGAVQRFVSPGTPRSAWLAVRWSLGPGPGQRPATAEGRTP